MLGKLLGLVRRQRVYIVTLVVSNKITNGRMYEFRCKVEAFSKKQAYAKALESFELKTISGKRVKA